MELKSYILNFTKTLKEIGQNNLDNYQRNIKTLKIEISDFANRKTNNAATYNERENKIYLLMIVFIMNFCTLLVLK